MNTNTKQTGTFKGEQLFNFLCPALQYTHLFILLSISLLSHITLGIDVHVQQMARFYKKKIQFQNQYRVLPVAYEQVQQVQLFNPNKHTLVSHTCPIITTHNMSTRVKITCSSKHNHKLQCNTPTALTNILASKAMK